MRLSMLLSLARRRLTSALASAALVTALEKKRIKGLSWQEASLDDVVAYLRTITGLNFVITAKALFTAPPGLGSPKLRCHHQAS